MNKLRRVDVLVDGKKITTAGHYISVEVEGVPVFRSPHEAFPSERKTNEFQAITLQMLLKMAEATFGHSDRFRIVESLIESPRTFSELKTLYRMTSPTLNYHLGRLLEAWAIHKTENEKYATTLLGELLFDYFLRFLKETEKLQKELRLKPSKIPKAVGPYCSQGINNSQHNLTQETALKIGCTMAREGIRQRNPCSDTC